MILQHIIDDNNLTKDITQEMLRVNLMNYFSEYFKYEIPTDKQLHFKNFSKVLYRILCKIRTVSNGYSIWGTDIQKFNECKFIKFFDDFYFGKKHQTINYFFPRVPDYNYVSRKTSIYKIARTYSYTLFSKFKDVLINTNESSIHKIVDLNKQRVHKSKAKELLNSYKKEDILRIETKKLINITNKYIITDTFSSHGFEHVLKNIICIFGKYVYLDCSNKTESIDGNGREYNMLNKLSKNLRNDLLQGFNEYDVSSSILTVNLSLAAIDNNKRTKDWKSVQRDFPLLFKGLVNKQEMRRDFMFAFGISEKEAKTMITSLIQQPNRNVFREAKVLRPAHKMNQKMFIKIKKYINEIKTLNSRNYRKFFGTEDESNLNYKIGKFSIKEIRNLAIDDLEKARKTKPKKFGKGKALKPKMMFRVYSIIEKQIRDMFIECTKMKSEDGYNQYIQLHDCVFTNVELSELDLKSISSYINNRLHILTSWSKESL